MANSLNHRQDMFENFERDFMSFFESPITVQDSKNSVAKSSFPVNIIDTPTTIIFEALVPVKPKIVCQDSTLTISVEESSKKFENEKFVRREFSYSKVSRSFSLDNLNLDLGSVEANYHNNTLTITINKLTKPKRFEVEVRTPSLGNNSHVDTVTTKDAAYSASGFAVEGTQSSTLREREGE